MRRHCVAERVGIAHGPSTRAYLDSASVGVAKAARASADQEQSMIAIAQTVPPPPAGQVLRTELSLVTFLRRDAHRNGG